MSTRRGFASLLLLGSLSLGCLHAEVASHPRKSSKKQTQLAALPSGPQGPVPQVPLDSIPAVAPQVSYRDGQLTIVAPNSTLGDILRAVRKQTAAEMEIPSAASERVVTHLGPGPARDIVAELLNGSKYNYVLLGSPSDSTRLTRVVLVAKSAPENPGVNSAQAGDANPQGNMAPAPPADASMDAPDAEPAAEENADDSTADQGANAVDADQQQPVTDQPGIKTPQQMLQEMQQRQLQMQQQMAPGQPPIPGGAAGIPRPDQQ
ncbi:MAG TPA: hypothetical protein VI386_26780 [Candidatus Sulfotelmatobacter sp.]